MAEQTLVEAIRRDLTGSGAARRLRRAGSVPAVLNTLAGETVHLTLEEHAFAMMLRKHQSESMLVDLSVDGAAAFKALLKDVQHDSLSDDILHADFKEVSMTETLQVSVAVTLLGEAAGVTQQGGLIEQVMHEVEVEGLAADLVEELTLDVSALMVGDRLTVGDIALSDKLAFVSSPEETVVTVLAPRLEEEEEEAEEGEEGAEEGAEPEVIGKDEEEKAEEA